MNQKLLNCFLQQLLILPSLSVIPLSRFRPICDHLIICRYDLVLRSVIVRCLRFESLIRFWLFGNVNIT